MKNNTLKYLLIGGALYAAFYLFKKQQTIKGIGATLTSTIKKASKYGAVQRDRYFYFIFYKGYKISWAQNGTYDEATNFYVQKQGREDNLTEDYFSGFFFPNFAQCIKFIEYQLTR